MPLAGESCAGAGNAQFQVALEESIGPLKIIVSLQSLNGIVMVTRLVFPGMSVPLDGLKLSPPVLEDADQERLPVLFWSSESVSVHVQPWVVVEHWLGVKLAIEIAGP